MEKKFNIKITDNETGEVIHDANTDCIIGGYSNEEGSSGMTLSSCTAFELGGTMAVVEDALKDQYKMHPELRLLTRLLSAHEAKELN